MTSPIAGPSATASESEKNGIPRLAFTEPSIGSTIDAHRPARAEGALAELLRDEQEIRLERLEPGDHRVLGRCVDRRRVVAALTAPQHRLPLAAGRELGEDEVDVRDAVAAEAEPVDGHTGWKSRPLVSLGKKYVVFCGITSPRRARSNTSSIRVARSRNAPSNSPESTRATASPRSAV